jgi:hypothetical protein
MKKFIHSSGMTGQMLYEPRGDKACIGIVHCGEREEAIVSGPALAFAKAAYESRDIDGYVALWRANRLRAEGQEAA